MNFKCKKCNADPCVCEYCKFKGMTDEEIKNSSKDLKNVIYFNSKDDNKSKKICPICKKVFYDYPAISRKDNKTLVCSECGMNEIMDVFDDVLFENEIIVTDE